MSGSGPARRSPASRSRSMGSARGPWGRQSAQTTDDRARLFTKLDARLGLSKDEWTALAARSMCAETREPDDTTRHWIRDRGPASAT